LLIVNGPAFSYEVTASSKDYQPINDKPFNLVFCSINYTKEDLFLKDVEDLIERLKKTIPFDEFIDITMVFNLKFSDKEEELFFKEISEYPFIEVDRDFLEDLYKDIKGNYKLVIIDRSGTDSIAQLSSIEKTSLIILGKGKHKEVDNFTKDFMHELGHSLGLRDESLDEHAKRCEPGYPNCARTIGEAQRWWGDLAKKYKRVRYIEGCCGDPNYIRPTAASFMNDSKKAGDFGPVNERFIRKALTSLRQANNER